MSTAQVQRFDANGLPLNEAPKVAQSEIAAANASNRKQWLTDRKGAISASDVAAILGIAHGHPGMCGWIKTGQVEDWKVNDSNACRPALRARRARSCRSRAGKLTRNVRIAHKQYPIAATCGRGDRVWQQASEAKTTGITGRVYGDWGDAMTDQIPDYYLVQLHTQLIVTEAEAGLSVRSDRCRGVVRFQAERNERVQCSTVRES